MAQMTKKKKRQLRNKQLKQTVKKKEKQDANGISRKKVKNTLHPNIFRILKIISICLIPAFYFIYSNLLIFCVIFTIVVGVLAKKTENYMNRSFIKSNHIKIPKYDSILAAIVIIITCAGGIMQLSSSKHRSSDNYWMDFVTQVSNVGSCLTGHRSVIRDVSMAFGTADVPDDLPSGGGGGAPSSVSLSDLPIEAVFSMMVSSINSVLIFLVPLSGLFSLWVLKKRKDKFDVVMNEFIADTYHDLSDEEALAIFTYGYDLSDEDKKLFIEDYNNAKELGGNIDLTLNNTTEESIKTSLNIEEENVEENSSETNSSKEDNSEIKKENKNQHKNSTNNSNKNQHKNTKNNSNKNRSKKKKKHH